MIWLYTPAFTPGSLQEVNEPDLADVDDSVLDYSEARTFIKLHDPAYLADLKKPRKVILKRSMNDTIRTYVVYDRKGTSHYDFVLRFDHLTTNRMKALEHFVLSSEGANIGFRSSGGYFAACTLLNPDMLITVDHPGTMWDSQGNEVVSEWGNVELQLRVIRGSIL